MYLALQLIQKAILKDGKRGMPVYTRTGLKIHCNRSNGVMTPIWFKWLSIAVGDLVKMYEIMTMEKHF